MKKELQKVIKKIVNKYHLCSECKDRNDCKFWKGENTAFDCGECTADEFSEGVHKTLKYLADIPWNEAIHAISLSVNLTENENQNSQEEAIKGTPDLLRQVEEKEWQDVYHL